MQQRAAQLTWKASAVGLRNGSACGPVIIPVFKSVKSLVPQGFSRTCTENLVTKMGLSGVIRDYQAACCLVDL